MAMPVSAQTLDYSNLQGQWNLCLKDSNDNSKSIQFMNDLVMDDDSCACKRDDGYWENLSELYYGFDTNNRLNIGNVTAGRLGPASTYSISTYQLNEKKNKLIIIDERKLKYRVLELTERWMRLEPLN
jgi:hypothetical protein